jgi:hypothetical protein
MKTILSIGLFILVNTSFAQSTTKVTNPEVKADCQQTDNCKALSFVSEGFNNPEVSETEANNAFNAADMVLKDIGRSIASEVEE